MAWTTLKKAIASTIKTNGNQEITGQVLQNTLNSIVNAIGENRTFAGVALPSTSPGTFDGPVFYITATPGTYANFDGLLVVTGEIALFVNSTSGTWSKVSAGVINSRNFPLSLEQGTIVLDTQEIKADSTRVFTKCLVDPSVIKSITTSGDIQMYVYSYDREGNYVTYTGWVKSFNFYQSDRRFLLTFSKTTTTNSITPEEVLEAISIEYVDRTITGLSAENYITIENTSINNLLLTDRFFAVDASAYLPKSSQILSGFKCISMRVKAGDVFTVHKLTGSTASARAYATFDKDGNRLFLADAGLVLDETDIEIEQDGYIVFNGISSKPISITAKKATISLDWAYSYLVGLLEHYSSSSSSSSSIELTPFFIKGAFFNSVGASYTPGEEYYEASGSPSNFDCISVKVKAGDYFEPKNLLGGSSQARAYALYDEAGTQLFLADPSALLNDRIDIEQDGYITFNVVKDTSYSLYGHFNFFSNWNWQYMIPIMQNIASLLSSTASTQSDINSINIELQFTEFKNYAVEGSNGTFQPANRVVCNTDHVWKKGDNLTAVLLGTVANNTNLTHSYLRVYSADKVLKGNYDLGAFNTTGIQQIDVSDLNIVLDDGDLVGILHAWYVSSSGQENYYDIATDTIVSGYIYRIGFQFERKAETLKESIQQIKKDLYGSLELTTSSEWDEGFLQTNMPNIIGPGLGGSVSFNPATTLSGWHYKIIECKPGDKFTVHIKGGTAQGRAWNFLYADKRVISQSLEGTWLDLELTAPEEAAYLVLNANNETSTVVGEPPIWQSDEEEDIQQIKILCFGNSFTQDSMSYVPFMLKNLAPNVKLTLGIAYIGGCPLVQHLANFTGEDQTLNSVVYTQVNYTYYKSVNGEAWTSQGSKNVDAMIADEKWDIITFQQNGGAAYQDWDTYFAPFIFKLHKSLFDKIGYGVKIGWLLTQGAYASDYDGLLNHWQGTADNSKKMLEVTGTSILFPFGTAAQNLRTTSLKEIGDGAAHNLMADTRHLQEGIGCMTAAYANTLVILNHLGIGKTGVIGEQTRVDSAFVTEKNIPGPNLGTSGVVGVTDDNCYLAQVAAECAVKKPYEVTDLTAVESGI